MKLSTKNKILCLIVAVCVTLLGVFMLKSPAVYADTTTVTSTDYFTVTDKDGSVSNEVTLDGTNLVVSMTDEATAKFKRSLPLNELKVSLTVPDTITEITFTITYKPEDVNFGSLDNEVYTIDSKISESYTVANSVETDLSFETVVVTDGIMIKNATDEIKFAPYSVLGKIIGDFSISVKGSGDIKVSSISIDGNAQSFALTDGKVTAMDYSLVLPNDSFASTYADGKLVKNEMERYSVSFNEYSVAPSTKTASQFKIVESDNVTVGNATSKTKYVWFSKGDNVPFEVKYEDSVVATYSVKTVIDETAPKYEYTPNQLENFKNALKEATYDEYTVEENGQEVTKRAHVRLGSSNYLQIPSMESIVSDDTTAYADLTKTVYYKTANSDWATAGSNMQIPLNDVGVYKFYVVFADKTKNTMEKTDFIDEDGNEVANALIFTFEVYNDAPISITASNQGKAYKGIEFTASSFTILAKNYDVEYSLYYAKDGVNFDLEIPALSELNESDENYEELSRFAYNGSLTFTPAELGKYKIVATIFENETMVSASSSIEIEAQNTPKVVKPASNWAKNNVWSIVFLSIGTLSLIGIIVVLCIPEKKEEK